MGVHVGTIITMVVIIVAGVDVSMVTVVASGGRMRETEGLLKVGLEEVRLRSKG